MFAPQKDSPSVLLVGDILNTDTLITVTNAAVLPTVIPYLLTLGIDQLTTETVTVTAVNLELNRLTVIRGADARGWSAGTLCARVFTSRDLSDLQNNVSDIFTSTTSHESLTAPHSATAAPTASRLIVRDAAGRAQVADGIAVADIATRGQLDAHSNASLPHRAVDGVRTFRWGLAVQGGVWGILVEEVL